MDPVAVDAAGPTPFPLDGGRVGVGGARAGGDEWGAGGVVESAAERVSMGADTATTPSQPSPIEGEGFRRDRTPEKTLKRARSMRAEPTWTEAKLWDRLRLLSVRFRRQAPMGSYVADFVCHRAALVIEVDGGVHDRTDVALRDLKRDAWFESQGYTVTRIPARQVEADLDGVMTHIRNLVSNRIGKVI